MQSAQASSTSEFKEAGDDSLSSWWPTVFVAAMSSALLFLPGVGLSLSVGEVLYYGFTSSAGSASPHYGEAMGRVWMCGLAVSVVLVMGLLAAVLITPRSRMGFFTPTALVMGTLAVQLVIYLARPVVLSLVGAYQG